MRSRLIAIGAFLIALGVLFALSPTAFAQGCQLCRDATAGSTPQARRALQVAIPILGIPAIGIFAGAMVLARRIKLGSGE
jgi:hypothetical protein